MRTLAALAAFATLCAGADTLSPTAAVSLDDGYRQMYNLQFDNAHRTFLEWEKEHPSDPLGPVSDAAAYLFSEFDRLHILQSEFFAEDENFAHKNKMAPDPQVERNFEAALDRARRLSPSASNDADVQFATVLNYGLRSDYLALIEKKYLPALSETKQARLAAERLLAAQPSYYDAYLAIGVENYLLSLKSAPVRLLLRAGGAETDKKVGLDKLRLTAERGRYLAPFAKLLLAVAALRDKDPAHAREQLAWLASRYPGNHLFREELGKVK